MWPRCSPPYRRATPPTKGSTMTRLTIAATALVLAAGTALSGCSHDPVSKAGGARPPVTLTIGTDDTKVRLSANLIEEFARQVDKASGGGVVVKPVWEAPGANQTYWDQKVARMVTRVTWTWA